MEIKPIDFSCPTWSSFENYNFLTRVTKSNRHITYLNFVCTWSHGIFHLHQHWRSLHLTQVTSNEYWREREREKKISSNIQNSINENCTKMCLKFLCSEDLLSHSPQKSPSLNSFCLTTEKNNSKLLHTDWLALDFLHWNWSNRFNSPDFTLWTNVVKNILKLRKIQKLRVEINVLALVSWKISLDL